MKEQETENGHPNGKSQFLSQHSDPSQNPVPEEVAEFQWKGFCITVASMCGNGSSSPSAMGPVGIHLSDCTIGKGKY